MNVPLNYEELLYKYLMNTLETSADTLFTVEKDRIANKDKYEGENSEEVYLRINSLIKDIDAINAILFKKFR